MIFTAIILFLSIAAFNVAVLFVVKRRLMTALGRYFEAQGENESQFAELCGLVTDQAAQKTAQSLKAVFMGVESGEGKRNKALDKAAAIDLVSQQYPWLAIAMKSFPSMAKKIMENPDLAAQAMAMMGTKAEKPANGKAETQLINFDQF